MNKVLNYRQQDVDVETAGIQPRVRQVFEQKYGSVSLQYLQQYLKDLNGGAQMDQRGSLDRYISLFKKGAVVGSLSVAAQQPLSYIRAASMINPTYLVQAFSKKGSYDELKKYSGVAVIKEMGSFDMSMGRSASEYIAQPDIQYTIWQKAKQSLNVREWETFKERWSDNVSFLPGKMDQITWVRMWEAVKLEQAAAHPNMDQQSDDFLQMCGKRFNDVMDFTQVYDSTLVRSSNMRSKNPIAKMSTAFMAEPTLTANMLYNAAKNIREPGGVKAAGAAVTIFAMSAFAQSAIKALFSALRGKGAGDDDKTIAEQMSTKLIEQLLNELNPLMSVPYLSDIINVMSGESIDRTDYSVLSDLYKSYQFVVGTNGDFSNSKVDFSNLDAGMYSIQNMAGPIAAMFGVPVKNVIRDIRAVYNATKLVYRQMAGEISTNWQNVQYSLLDDTPFYDGSSAAYYERYVDAAANGRSQEAADILEYLESGLGKTESAIGTGIKKAVKGSLTDNRISAKAATAVLKGAGIDSSGWQMQMQYNDWEDDGYVSDYIDAVLEGSKEKATMARTNAQKAGRLSDRKAFDEAYLAEIKRRVNATNGDHIDDETAMKLLTDVKGKNEAEALLDDWHNPVSNDSMYHLIDRNDVGGVIAYRKEMESQGKSGTSVDNAIKKGIVNSYVSGELTREQAIAMYKKTVSTNSKDVYLFTEEMDYTKNSGGYLGDTKYVKTGKVLDAVKAGNSSAIKSESKSLVDNGVKQSEVTLAVKKAYAAGEITEAQARTYIKAIDPKADSDDLYWEVREWNDYKTHKGEEGYSYSKYGTLHSAIESGRGIAMAVKEYKDHGVSKESIGSAIASKWKPVLVKMKQSGKSIANLQSYILDAYEAAGYSRSKAQRTVNGWFKDKRTK